MEGLQEPVTGSGLFLAQDLSNGAAAAPPPPLPPARKVGWLGRLWERLSRWLLRRATASTDVQRSAAATGGAPAKSRITFRLALHAGGATGPVLNLLLAPMLKPVAEDLALKIASAVEAK
jgi:hypothetical protein